MFDRYHEVGVTKIRDQEMVKWRERCLAAFQEEGRLSEDEIEAKLVEFNLLSCEKIAGYDANALYLWAIRQDISLEEFAPTPMLHQKNTCLRGYRAKRPSLKWRKSGWRGSNKCKVVISNTR